MYSVDSGQSTRIADGVVPSDGQLETAQKLKPRGIADRRAVEVLTLRCAGQRQDAQQEKQAE
jgi:hypothetical protein